MEKSKYVYNVWVRHIESVEPGKRRILKKFIINSFENVKDAVACYLSVLRLDAYRNADSDEEDNRNTIEAIEKDLINFDKYATTDRGYVTTMYKLHDYEHYYIGPGQFILERVLRQ